MRKRKAWGAAARGKSESGHLAALWAPLDARRRADMRAWWAGNCPTSTLPRRLCPPSKTRKPLKTLGCPPCPPCAPSKTSLQEIRRRTRVTPGPARSLPLFYISIYIGGQGGRVDRTSNGAGLRLATLEAAGRPGRTLDAASAPVWRGRGGGKLDRAAWTPPPTCKKTNFGDLPEPSRYRRPTP